MHVVQYKDIHHVISYHIVRARISLLLIPFTQFHSIPHSFYFVSFHENSFYSTISNFGILTALDCKLILFGILTLTEGISVNLSPIL